MLDRSIQRSPRVSRSAFTPASPRAFTLAELLIVIAIIGVLIAILLPTLAAARRSANSIKCLSALKQIGTAFQQYAQENHRAFPVVYWNNGQNAPGTAAYKPWQDFLVKYLHKKDPTVLTAPAGAADILQYKDAASVLWGCPSYDPTAFVNTAAIPAAVAPNCFNTGYGMNRYALAPYKVGTIFPDRAAVVLGSATTPGNLAMIDKDRNVYGSFFKMEQWGRSGATKGLLADSNTFDLHTVGSTMAKLALTCQPFTYGPVVNQVDVDGIRHLSPNSSKQKARTQKGVNMLFVDGHAATVSPLEAWIALRGAGSDYSN